MSAFSIALVTTVVLFGSEGLKLPDYITPCSRTDPNFNQCALEHGKAAIPRILKGDPKYGVPNLDPFFADDIDAKEFGIAFTLTEVIVEGAKDITLKDIKFDFDKMTVGLQLHSPFILFSGKYNVSGRLVSLPIAGNGYFNISGADVIITYKTSFNLTKKSDGHTYLQPLTQFLRMDPKTGSVYAGNLFNGNKLLGEVMNKLMNDNYHLVILEAGQAAFRELGNSVNGLVKRVAEKVPYEELFTKED